MTELPRHPFMKYVQFEVKTGEGRKKKAKRSQEKRLKKFSAESQPELRKGREADQET